MPQEEDIKKQNLRISVDFTAGPGVAGMQPAHVIGAVSAFKDNGLKEISDGLTSSFDGSLDQIADAVKQSILRSFGSGATHFRMVVFEKQEANASVKKYLDSLEPVLKSLKTRIVPINELVPGDVPLEWEGKLVAGAREQMSDTIDTLQSEINAAKEKFGNLSEISRKNRLSILKTLQTNNVLDQKQAVERIAIEMNVSRATVYNDLKLLKTRTI